MGNGGHIDDLRILQTAFDITDSCLDHTLLFPGGMVFGILLEVAQFARLGDRWVICGRSSVFRCLSSSSSARAPWTVIGNLVMR